MTVYLGLKFRAVLDVVFCKASVCDFGCNARSAVARLEPQHNSGNNRVRFHEVVVHVEQLQWLQIRAVQAQFSPVLREILFDAVNHAYSGLFARNP